MRALALSLCTLFACSSGSSWQGIARAEATGGPVVRFDLTHTPLPEIPFPNDVATRPDPRSPTGLRVNAALIAPTSLEANVRGEFDRLDGFGTYAPITVSFAAGTDGSTDLDLLNLYALQNDGDPSNDAVLLIDLSDGKRWPLDINGGHFPYELENPSGYFLNDPLAGTTNLLFPVDAAALGGPNFLHPPDPAYASTHGGVPQSSDDLLTFYERATHTLILRPILPLPQEHRFAVVLTKRLIGTNGKAIASPFPGVNHALQTSELSALPGLLPQGTQLSDVAFAWAFTTQSQTRDLETLRAGIYGIGPLAALSLQFPVQVSGQDPNNPNGYASRLNIFRVIDQPLPGESPFLLSSARFVALLQDPILSGFFFGGDAVERQALIDTFQYVDYLVFGTFVSPDLLADKDRPANDATFQIDPRLGAVRASNAIVPFVFAIPKAQSPQPGPTSQLQTHKAPFPVVLLGHGYKSNRMEGIFAFSGSLAKFGIASAAIDAYGHGIGIPAQPTAGSLISEQTVQALLAARGLGGLATAVLATRARDLDNSGVKSPGGDFWSADAFHTRDVVRQSIVDWMQLSRLLQTFDGQGTMSTPPDPTTGSVKTMLAGDFNGDGVPDLGGPAIFPVDLLAGGTPAYAKGDKNPGVDTFVFGISLGGILSGILPAVEPNIIAAVTVSGAGGLSDVGIRSAEGSVKDAVFLEVFGPLLATCPWDPATNRCDQNGQPALVWETLDVNRDAKVPIAPLALLAGDTLTACDLAQVQSALPPDAQLAAALPSGCRSTVAIADANGAVNLRLSLAADAPQLLTQEDSPDAGTPPTVNVQVVQAGDPIHVVITAAKDGAVRAIDAFAFDTTFYGVEYKSGTPLQAVGRGFGTPRNSPDFRRLWALTQMALGPGDPINYAPHWFADTLPERTSLPANVIVMATSGDPIVPVNTGIALARAAGLVELNAPDPTYPQLAVSDDRLLIEGGVVEGVARLNRFASTAPGTPRALLAANLVCDPASCDTGRAGGVLLDPSSLYCDAAGANCEAGLGCDASGANCTDRLAAPRLIPPLRTQLERTTRSGNGGAVGTAALVIPYLNRTGQHGFRNPQPHRQFDTDQFLVNLIGRYFETRGVELHFDSCQAQLAACPWIYPPPAPQAPAASPARGHASSRRRQ